MMKAMTITILTSLAACGGADVSRDVGARCEKAADCAERCLTGGKWPGGFCTLSCDTDSDCPTDTRCISEEGGVCAYVCNTTPECGFLLGDYVCKDHACVGP
ncbi:MAG: hypothetical protein NT062_23245 [Proteobacteria bacterium]|nr:hypothetical protein [Pseudomonadota bacterium]